MNMLPDNWLHKILAYNIPGGGLLKYDLGRDVPLRLEKLIHFYTKFWQKMRPIFIPEPQILSKFY